MQLGRTSKMTDNLMYNYSVAQQVSYKNQVGSQWPKRYVHEFDDT